MKTLKALILCLILLLPSTALATGTCTVTYLNEPPSEGIMAIQYACVGDASSGAYPTAVSKSVNGFVFLVESILGSTKPTASWAATLKNGAAIDVMGGNITGGSATLPQQFLPAKSGLAMGPMTLAITGNSVASASITIKVWMWKQP